ncbi:MAG TPA: hypothetical protein VII49_12425 [Rhizomicrobium sp.]
MSDLPAVAAPAYAPSPAIFEQMLFELSPAGTVVTAIGIFVVLLGSFEALAAATHYPLADQLSFSPQEGAWPAAILSLLVAVGLGMQRYARLKDVEDAPALARIIPCNTTEMGNEPALRSRIRWAGAGGAVLGVAFGILAVPAHVRSDNPTMFLWFAAAMGLAGAMFARGAVMTKAGARRFALRIDRDLKIDLLRVDQLSIIGRSSARTALIWVSVAAVVSLFFVSGHAPGLVIVTVVFSAAMAFWTFFRSLERVHRRIVSAKRDELDRLRHAIADSRLQAVHDHAAAARLHGLLAYEGRIERVHEWPFDQLTLLRVGAYVLIPALPALGQAALRVLSEHAVQ